MSSIYKYKKTVAKILGVIITTHLLLTACTGSSATNPSIPMVKLSDVFTLKQGESIQLANTPLKVQFERVVKDSRCPSGTRCVWSGVASINLNLSSENRTKSVQLDTLSQGSFHRVITVFKYTIHLVSLKNNKENKNRPIVELKVE